MTVLVQNKVEAETESRVAETKRVYEAIKHQAATHLSGDTQPLFHVCVCEQHEDLAKTLEEQMSKLKKRVHMGVCIYVCVYCVLLCGVCCM